MESIVAIIILIFLIRLISNIGKEKHNKIIEENTKERGESTKALVNLTNKINGEVINNEHTNNS